MCLQGQNCKTFNDLRNSMSLQSFLCFILYFMLDLGFRLEAGKFEWS